MTATEVPILVTVIGGYLGAGKTTLVNHILRSADEQVAVLVNDFGEINIDEALIESSDGDTISLANGCICCSVVDGFAVALARIRALEPRPERLVIEASGVADPSKVTPFAYGPGFALDGTLVVVDAERIEAQIRNDYIGDVIIQQVQSADLLVVNKTDLVSDLTAAVEVIGGVTSCPTIAAINGALPLPLLLGIDRGNEAGTLVHAARGETDAESRFTSWTEVHDDPLDRAALEQHLLALDPSVIRVKGLVRLRDSHHEQSIVQKVGDRMTITSGGDWRGGRSQLVFIALRTGE